MEIILVTGGAGFIGCHTCLSLLEKGFEVFVIDSYINSHKKSLEKVLNIFSNSKEYKPDMLHVFEGDIRDYESIYRVFDFASKKNKTIDGVIHFAGLKSVSNSIHKPLEYWDVNVRGTHTLLKVMDNMNCKNLVFSSSATVYANSNKNLKEDFRKESINPYASTKMAVEQLLNDIYLSDQNWRICNLRYFNPIGAHESGLIGENPLGGTNNLFPLINLVASNQLSNIEIYGIDWPTKDGTCVRDYIHVMDIAEGHLSALHFLFANKPHIYNFNLGTGFGYSVLELIRTFEEVNKIKIPFVLSPRRDGDNAYVVADNSMALSLLNWRPSRTIQDMCRDGWKWQKKNRYGY